ncbi:MAG TPA: PIN domain-containing protein [Thermoplasmata archaeon]|nr:PIN domain-containing protein [Thermoplasmata archaeon]
MKGFDTPVLLEILEGRPATVKLVKRLAGEELCTTEWNLFELEAIARQERGASLDRRLAAIERLRRGLSVLAIDEKANRAAAAAWRDGGQGLTSASWLILGALVANGCTEWFTSRAAAFPKVPGRLRVTRCVA